MDVEVQTSLPCAGGDARPTEAQEPSPASGKARTGDRPFDSFQLLRVWFRGPDSELV